MSAWLALISRELFILLVLALVGSSLAAALPGTIDSLGRISLAPILGYAIASAALHTTMWEVPARKGWPVLAFMVLVSPIAAILISKCRAKDDAVHKPKRFPLASAAALAMLTVVICLSFSAPVAIHDSTGPVGGYVLDAAGYQAEIDGAQERSIHTAATELPDLALYPDLTLRAWAFLAKGSEVFGDTSVAAHIASALRLHGGDIQFPFFISLVCLIPLGIFAGVRTVTSSNSWLVIFGPALALGPFLRQLVFDGSQGAIAGLALVIPLFMCAWLALSQRSVMFASAAAVLLAGLSASYPVILPPIIVGLSCAVFVCVVRAGLGRDLKEGALLISAAVAVGLIAILASPVAFVRNLEYLKFARDVALKSAGPAGGLPKYDLGFETIPSWLTQTREFYEPRVMSEILGSMSTSSLTDSVLFLIIPIICIAFAGYAAYRRPVLLILLVVGGVSASLALSTSAQGCSYCTQRNLLVWGPILMTLVGCGFVLLLGGRRTIQKASVAAGAVLLTVVLFRGYQTASRTESSAFALNQGVGRVLEPVRDTKRPLTLEGFGLSAQAPAELPFTYHRVNEILANPLSIAVEQDERNGLAYLGGARPVGKEFRPDYEYVMTRFGGVSSGRRVIARDGPFALEQRLSRDDTIVTGGVEVATLDQDPTGRAWLVPGAPLTIWVVGTTKSSPSFLRTKIKTAGQASLTGSNLPTSTVREPGALTLCSKVPFVPIRSFALYSIRFTPSAGPTSGPLSTPEPARGAFLESVRASHQPC